MSDTNNTNACKDKPCQTRTFQRPNSGSGNENSDMSGRPILYTGVLWVGLFRRFLIPRTCGSSLRSQPSHEEIQRPEAKDMANLSVIPTSTNLLLNKASPTPINDSQTDEEDVDVTTLMRRQKSHSPLAALAYQMKEVSAAASDHIRRLSEDIRDLVDDGTATVADAVEAMREEEAAGARLVAVTLSGLSGWLVGGRRGHLTRLVYSATGATAMAVICYPEEARYYNQECLTALLHAIHIGLDFIRNGPQKTLGSWSKTDHHNGDKEIKLEPNHSVSQIYPSNRTEKLFASTNDFDDGASDSNHDQSKPKSATYTEAHKQRSNLDMWAPYSQNPQPHKAQELFTSDVYSPKSTTNHPESHSETHFAPASQQPQISSNLETKDDREHPKPFPHNAPNQNPTKDCLPRKEKEPSRRPYTLHEPAGLASASDGYVPSSSKARPNDTERISPSSQPMISLPEPIIEEFEEPSDMENGDGRNQNLPINKKLSRYYIRESETFSSSHVGYEDLYTKRN